MKKYEAVIILNPNLSSKASDFEKDFEKLLKSNSFSIQKKEDVGRRQLAYSINNHNKGHYLLFNIEGDASKLIDIENKIKYNESIIRHLFISVKEHNGEDSQLLQDSKNKKNDSEEKAVDKDKNQQSKSSESNEKQQVKEKMVEADQDDKVDNSSESPELEKEEQKEQEDKDE
ncbi:MAG: 30S ribosomal protein S6 [Gammaproteobacteria bacterium]|nr:MAG: 30S ribosomal protein S6 [Gammaproteobacteria bacterium TMED234]|tara:strand:+ start:900 stop:1418 length:519 start_codon:yes stop_codon:yes gene_type:complete